MSRPLTTSDAWREERYRVARRNPAAALPGVEPDDLPRMRGSLVLGVFVVMAAVVLVGVPVVRMMMGAG